MCLSSNSTVSKKQIPDSEQATTYIFHQNPCRCHDFVSLLSYLVSILPPLIYRPINTPLFLSILFPAFDKAYLHTIARSLSGTMSQLTSSQLLAATAHHQPGVGESISQPIAEHFHHRTITAPRVLTQGDRPAGLPLAINASQTSTGLRDQVFAEVQARLNDANINISDARLYSFLLPVSTAILLH